MSLLQKWCHLVVGHTLHYTVSNFKVNQTDSSWDTAISVSSPISPYLTIIRPSSTWEMASELTPQQLITQSAQATANAITSALTARTASISLPIYDWDSQDAYHSFSIFHHTLENSLLLIHIHPDSKDNLRYVFAALGTKSLEMHAQWMPTGSKEEQQATKAKASAFLESTPATTAVVTHHLHPLRTVPTAPNSTQLEEQTAQHVIPIVPNATIWDTGDPNAVVASHSTQGMHLHLGHSRGSPDAHLGTTTTAMGRVTRQTP